MRTSAPLAAAGVLAALLLLPQPAAAQEAEPAGATIAGADVQVDFGDQAPDTVAVTYRLAGDIEPGGTIAHQVMPRPGTTIQDLEAGDGAADAALTGDGNGVDVTLDGAAGAYTLHYTVARDADVYAVPLPVPSLPTERNSTVQISTLLPPGQQLTGEFMPSISAEQRHGDRVELQHRGGEVPSVVLAQYGTGGGQVTISDWVTWVMALAFAATVVAWWVRSRHTTTPREVPA